LKLITIYIISFFVGFFFITVRPTAAQTTDPALDEHPIRCLTSIILDYEQNPDSREDLGHILGINSLEDWEKKKQNQAQIMAADTLMSASGRFQLIYETSGDNAVPLTDANQNTIPDYVEWAANYADSSWTHLVVNLGFVDPVPDLSKPINIRFLKMNSYGFFQSGTRTMTIHNNFTTAPFPTPNRDPEGNQKGALKVTVAHELKHAIQFATIGNPGSNWIEMDATMAEEVVFPTVKDYLNYLTSGRTTGNTQSLFLNPSISAPNQYYHATFGLYYRERFGDQFWVDVWNRANSVNTTNLFLMMEQELMSRNHNPDDELITMYLWHLASGSSGSVDGYGFKDKLLYPNSIPSNTDLESRLPYTSTWRSFTQRSANFFIFSRDTHEEFDELYLALLRQLGSKKRMGFGVIYWLSDGSVRTQIIRSDDDREFFTGQTSSRNTLNFGFYGIRIPVESAYIRKIGVALVNPNAFPQSAQLVTGTNLNPSTNQLANFTRTAINPDARTEAEALLDKLVLQSSVTQIDNPIELLSADVSANGRATTFDASLILQKGSGILTHFPADPNHEVFVPRPSLYALPGQSVSNNYTLNQIATVQNIRLEPVFGDPDHPNGIDDTLRVHLISESSTLFHSAFIELDYDTTSIFFDSFSAAFDQSASYTVSRNSTISNRLRLALASDLPVQPSDTLITLHFTPKKDTSVTLSLRYVQIDEHVSQQLNLSKTVHVRPSDAVSIERPTELPIAVRLNPAYPNPFNPTTNIPFEINELSIVTLELFDILGRRVATIVNDSYPAGSYTMPFQATSLASGIYNIQLTVIPEGNPGNSHRLTQRITLLK
jgi:hypothetical protein